MKTIAVILFAAVAAFSLVSCGPSSQTVKEDGIEKVQNNSSAEFEQKAEKVVLTEEDKMNINKLSSFAQTKRQQKKFREMVEYINQIMEVDRDFDHAKNILLFWRGNGYEELGLKDSALTDYERFAVLKPDHSQVLVLLDYMYVTNGNIEKAIETAEKMIELDKEDKTLLKKIGKYNFQYAENLKAEDPNNPEIEEYATRAIENFEEYIEHYPEDEEINNLLTFLISKFLDQQALKIKLENNLQKNPDDAKTIERLAAIYYDEGNAGKASELLEKLLEKHPDNLKALKRLIRITKNNIDKAITYNKKAMVLDEANETYNINLAKLYTEKKRFAEARTECVRALSKNSKNTNIHKAWASVFTESIGACEIDIEYQDKLIFVIAYGLYEKAGDTRRTHAMKESGQVPSKSDYFTNKSTRLPIRECYKWINTEWEEVKYIEKFLNSL
jgi:tetratricopeptide (TPR) repeat protein